MRAEIGIVLQKGEWLPKVMRCNLDPDVVCTIDSKRQGSRSLTAE